MWNVCCHRSALPHRIGIKAAYTILILTHINALQTWQNPLRISALFHLKGLNWVWNWSNVVSFPPAGDVNAPLMPLNWWLCTRFCSRGRCCPFFVLKSWVGKCVCMCGKESLSGEMGVRYILLVQLCRTVIWGGKCFSSLTVKASFPPFYCGPQGNMSDHFSQTGGWRVTKSVSQTASSRIDWPSLCSVKHDITSFRLDCVYKGWISPALEVEK